MTGKNLTDQQRNLIVQSLLQKCQNGKPIRGTMVEIAAKYDVTARTVRRLWAAAKKQQEQGQIICLKSGRGEASKKKRIQVDLELIQSLELQKRATIRKLATCINVGKSTVGRWARGGLIKAHTSVIRTTLTAPQKLVRLRFSIEALEFDRVLNILRFKSMHNTIHIDEKWFYITKAAHRFYLTPSEAEPHRTCKIKKFITKVMFMCAVCRPIFGVDGQVLFDGKIGIFPFTQKVAAQRTSKNRPVGTLETKPIQSITKEVTKTCLIDQILPSIKAKWPALSEKLIFIQQDNAKPHIKDSDEDFRRAASMDDFDIRLVNQPANSPDTNVNDLGWFRAIQSIQVETPCLTIDDLVNAVVLSFEQLSPQTLNKVFLSLQGCMIEIMRVKGDNNYRIPHLKKDSLMRDGTLPEDLEVPRSLVLECIQHVIDNETIVGLEDLQNRLGLIVEDWTEGREDE